MKHGRQSLDNQDKSGGKSREVSTKELEVGYMENDYE